VLKWRLIGALAIILPLSGLCWLDFNYDLGRPGLWLFPIMPLLGVLAVEEILQLLGSRRHFPIRWACHFGTFASIMAAGVPIWMPVESWTPQLSADDWILFALAAGFVVAIMGEMMRFSSPGNAMVDLGLTIFTIVYVGLLLGFIVRLRLVGSELEGGQHVGLLAMLSMIVVTKLADTGAYFVGSAIGRTKIVPRLSPGKTAEGWLAGLIFSCVGSWVVFFIVGPRWFSIEAGGQWGWLIFALLVAPAGMLGDLAESMFKRDTGSKDSSTWLIGLGGVLDVLDSMLIAAPVALLCWKIGIIVQNP